MSLLLQNGGAIMLLVPTVQGIMHQSGDASSPVSASGAAG